MRLSLLEDLAFRRMLDYFYETEKPLPCELDRVSKLIGMRDHQEEVRQILNEFWTETEQGWVNSRAQEEIDIYQSKADAARVNGRKGGRPPKPKETQSVILANPDETGSQANHKPLTNNHKPNIPYQLIVDAYHEKLPELAGLRTLTDDRKRKIKALWGFSINDSSGNKLPTDTVEFWENYFTFVKSVDFLMGRNGDWQANFDFLLTKSKFIKTIEGSY